MNAVLLHYMSGSATADWLRMSRQLESEDFAPLGEGPLLPEPVSPAPLATVKAYRRTGAAVVTIERRGRKHRYVVSLRRYHQLREWTLTRAARRWKTSGAWMRSSLECVIWEERA